MALDRRNYAQLVETTHELALKCGGAEIVGRLVPGWSKYQSFLDKCVYIGVVKHSPYAKTTIFFQKKNNNNNILI